MSRPERRPLALALPAGMILLLLAWSFPALESYNVTWDEALGDLFFGERYLSFFTSFDPAYLDFRENPYPPERRPDLFVSPFKVRPWEYYPVANTLAAASSWLFSRQLGWLDPFDGYHALNLLLAALLLWSLFHFQAERLGLFAAVLATGLLFTSPRIFSHMMANIKDFPLMAFYALTLLLFFRAYEAGSTRGLLAAGALWGLTLGTKANALFLPAVPLAMLLVPRLPEPWQGRRGRLALTLAAAGTLGALVLLASWPYLWAGPLERILEHLRYIGFRRGITRPESVAPAFEAILLTTPTVLLALFAAGLVPVVQRGLSLFRPRKRAEDESNGRLAIFLLAWIAASLCRFLLPQAVNFDGVRHFLELFPAMATVAGLGGAWLITALARTLGPRLPTTSPALWKALAAGLLLLPGALALLRTHPFQIAYWNALAGGHAGAYARGLPQAGDYWGMSYRLGLEWLNENAEEGALLAVPVVEHAVRLVAPERLRPDITLLPITTPFTPRIAPERLARMREDSRRAPLYVMFVERRDWMNQLMLDCLTQLRPVATWDLEGAPILYIYRYRYGAP